MILKSQSTWFALIAISFIYALAAFALLNTQHKSIAFTKKELVGLGEYEALSPRYFAEHSPELRREMQAIGDSSNLILDPEKTSYYTINLLFNFVPLMIEHVSIYRHSPLGDASFHLAELAHTVEVIAQEKSAESDVISAQFAQLRTQLLSKKNATLSEADAGRIIGHITAMHQAAVVLLKKLLTTRLAAQYQHYWLMIAIIVVLYAVLIALILFSLRNYVGKREIMLAQNLVQKNAELEKFAYAAAHDLKEPVRTMRCFATLLREDTKQEYIEVIENTAQRAEQMINDLLDYARIEKGGATHEICDCGEQIAAALQDVMPLISAHNPTITVGEMPRINVTPSMFRRVMLNVIENAIKYRRQEIPLTIDISATRENGMWIFTVRDNGIGIEAEHTEAVFEPFRRLQTKESEGNGIGLTTCRKIIEGMGGKIWVKTPSAQGTTLQFSIPATQE